MKISNCPICGFPWDEQEDIEEVKSSFAICDCCGCEYGYDDTSTYREKWLAKGSPWFAKKARPQDWNLEEQLKNIMPNWNELRFN